MSQISREDITIFSLSKESLPSLSAYLTRQGEEWRGLQEAVECVRNGGVEQVSLRFHVTSQQTFQTPTWFTAPCTLDFIST